MIYQPDDIIVGGDDTANYEQIAQNVGTRLVDDFTTTARQFGDKLRATITGARAPANVSPAPVVPARSTPKINPIVIVAVGALVVAMLLKKGKR